MNENDVINVVEAEVTSVAKTVEEKVVSAAEQLKAGISAHKQDYLNQIANLKTDLINLKKTFDDKQVLIHKLEGAVSGLDNLLKSIETK